MSLFLLTFFGCGLTTGDSTANFDSKNIILFIGDGMGGEQRKAARWYTDGVDGTLAMDDMTSSGYAGTTSANNEITDSAASATAMATGIKTNNRVIGMDPDLNRLTTILEEAEHLGKSTGIITTVRVTNATTAAFAAHIEDRRSMEDIGEQMMSADIDVILGGGESQLLPDTEQGCFQYNGVRTDGRNLISEAVDEGYTYVCDDQALSSVDPASVDQLLGLFADHGMIYPYTPSLSQMVEKALGILSKNPNGFFLIVEEGHIDHAGHQNEAMDAILYTISLDQAVATAKEFADTHYNTLVIVTADHETGGMSVTLSSSGLESEDGPFNLPDGNLFYVNWTTGGHTGVDVPVTAEGPGSRDLEGLYENTHIYEVMSGQL